MLFRGGDRQPLIESLVIGLGVGVCGLVPPLYTPWFVKRFQINKTFCPVDILEAPGFGRISLYLPAVHLL